MTDTIIWERNYKELPPVKYWITAKEVGKWWWRRTEYYLQSEYGSLGPFTSEAEIRMCARQADMTIGS
jgi:hypothetical protein